MTRLLRWLGRFRLVWAQLAEQRVGQIASELDLNSEIVDGDSFHRGLVAERIGKEVERQIVSAYFVRDADKRDDGRTERRAYDPPGRL